MTYVRTSRGRPVGWERPRVQTCCLIGSSALCVGGYDDHNNVAYGGTDQSTDGAALVIVSAYARNAFAAAISSWSGEGGHGRVF